MNNKHNYREYIKTADEWYKMLYNRQLLIRSVSCFRTNGIDIDYINRNEIVHKYE